MKVYVIHEHPPHEGSWFIGAMLDPSEAAAVASARRVGRDDLSDEVDVSELDLVGLADPGVDYFRGYQDGRSGGFFVLTVGLLFGAAVGLAASYIGWRANAAPPPVEERKP